MGVRVFACTPIKATCLILPSRLNYSLDICSGSLGGFICPLPQIALNLTQPLVLPDNLDIPELAYTVPNLEAFATIQLIDAKTGARRACVTAKLSNGKSTKQLGVLIGTGAFAVVAILLSWWHTGWNITRSDGTVGPYPSNIPC